MIRKQDATAVITSVADNRAGQSLAWEFVRDHWNFMFTQWADASTVNQNITHTCACYVKVKCKL